MGLRSFASISASACLISAALAAPATAGPTGGLTNVGWTPRYTVVDLGDDFNFVKDATGDTISVTGSNGFSSAFTKYPVMYDGNGYPNSHDATSSGDSAYWLDASGRRQTEFVLAADKYGSLTYRSDYSPDLYGGYSTQAFFDGKQTNAHGPLDWFTLGSSGTDIAKDFNTSGQVVGSYGREAVISGSNGLTGGPILDEYLNSDIAAELLSRIHLTAGLFIDDLGRVVASGTLDGVAHDFLLTPSDLPAPAPEPSTLAILGMALAGWAVRTRRRTRISTAR